MLGSFQDEVRRLRQEIDKKLPPFQRDIYIGEVIEDFARLCRIVEMLSAEIEHLKQKLANKG